MLVRFLIPACVALAYLTAPNASAQAIGHGQIASTPSDPAPVRTDTPSGYPVPRFVSLKQVKTPCRRGPSFDQPVRYTFMRPGVPVLVVAETTDHWRKIRDFAGDECWAHALTLTAQTHVIVDEALDILARPAFGAPVRARLGAGALIQLENQKNGWARLNVALPVSGAGRRIKKPRQVRGWAPASRLWGIDAAAAFAHGAHKPTDN